MKPEIVLTHRFVTAIPEELEERTVYVSVEFTTVAHRCFCGCGREVVTPLTPKDWSLNFDGETISLNPSVGNWNIPCQSHYWIRRNRVQWALPWSRRQIEGGRAADARAKVEYYDEEPSQVEAKLPSPAASSPPAPKEGFWRRWWRRLFGVWSKNSNAG
jgi:Family of unknown function (DUF6527)